MLKVKTERLKTQECRVPSISHQSDDTIARHAGSGKLQMHHERMRAKRQNYLHMKLALQIPGAATRTTL